MNEGNGDGILWILLAGPAAAFFTYGYIRKKYRNADKRYQYEQTTDVATTNLEHSDQHVGRKNRQRSSKISGRNDHNSISRARYVKVFSDGIVHAEVPPDDAVPSDDAVPPDANRPPV